MNLDFSFSAVLIYFCQFITFHERFSTKNESLKRHNFSIDIEKARTTINNFLHIIICPSTVPCLFGTANHPNPLDLEICQSIGLISICLCFSSFSWTAKKVLQASVLSVDRESINIFRAITKLWISTLISN